MHSYMYFNRGRSVPGVFWLDYQKAGLRRGGLGRSDCIKNWIPLLKLFVSFDFYGILNATKFNQTYSIIKDT